MNWVLKKMYDLKYFTKQSQKLIFYGVLWRKSHERTKEESEDHALKSPSPVAPLLQNKKMEEYNHQEIMMESKTGYFLANAKIISTYISSR